MKKTYTANIGGLVYHIEEDAYERLNSYLKSLRVAFGTTAGGDEIIADIELRISELFQQKLHPGKEVITMADVDDVIKTMGRPEDYINEGGADTAWEDAKETGYSHTRRRIYRDPDNKVVGGVCSGISAYFGWDPIVLRLIFAIMFVAYGSGVLLYLILLIIIPEAKTTAEKLQMHGDPVNVDNISRKVSESVRSAYDSLNRNDFGARVGDFFQNLFHLIGTLLHQAVKVAGKLIGAVLLIAGITGLLVVVTLLLGVNNSLSFMDGGYSLAEVAGIYNQYIFESEGQKILFYASLALVVVIPLIAFLFWGIQILSRRRSKGTAVSITLVVLWVAGCFGLIATSLSFSGVLRSHSESEVEIALAQPSDSLLILSSNASTKYTSFGLEWEELCISKNFLPERVTFPGSGSTNVIELENATLTIDQNASDSLVKLIATVEAFGSTNREAEISSRKIKPNVVSTGDSLFVSRYITLQEGEKLRGQHIQYRLLLPVGMKVKLTKSAEELIYDIPNTTNTLDSEMIGEIWLMTKKGLTCFTCSDTMEGGNY